MLLISTLQHIPDVDDPAGMVAAYRDAVCSGSYLAVSHFGPDEHLLAGQKLFDRMHLGEPLNVKVRDRDSVAVLFSGFELVSPGIVPIVLWRPHPDDDLGHNPERHSIFAGLGRKSSGTTRPAGPAEDARGYRQPAGHVEQTEQHVDDRIHGQSDADDCRELPDR